MEHSFIGLEHALVQDSASLQHSFVGFPTEYFRGVSSSNSSISCFCKDLEGWGPVNESFRFTPCFLDGFFLAIPSILLLISGSYQIRVLSKRKLIPTRIDWHLASKLFLVLVQAAFYLVISIISLITSPSWYSDVAFWSPIIAVVGLLIASWLHYVEHFRSLIPNGVLLFYWLFSILFGLIRVLAFATSPKFVSKHTSYFIFTILTLVNSLFIFTLEWVIPKTKSSYELLADLADRSPLETADIFSRITFSWMSPLMKKGYETYLTDEDLPELPSEETTHKASTDFSKYWQQQLNKAKRPSLSIAMAKAFGGQFIIGGAFKATQDVLAFVQPQMLRLLIKFVNDYTSDTADVKPPLAKGFSIAFGMFCVSVCQTAALHQYFQRAFSSGMRLKSSLTSAIYQKSLVLSNEDRATKSTGDIVNLMSVDTQRLQDLTQYGQTLWSGPFQITLCLLSLHNLLGNSMWAGVVVMVIMVPINGVVASYQKKLQKVQMKNKDQRTRLTSEILTNIKSLKLYGWEVPFMNRLNHVRNDQELKTLRSIGLLGAVGTFLWSCSPFFVSCSTFAVFVYTQDRPLSTDIVFPALTLFNLLSFPLAIFPMVITAIIEASVAVSRLTAFFVSEEIQPDAVIRLERAENLDEESVIVENATFLWERKSNYKVALTNINYVASKGQLSCVVGKVGSGKSSLLQSILGDLYKTEGTVTIKGRVAYVSQVPWIINATVKENILFGTRFDPDFYNRTIAACALADDLAILPDGDETQVGEKGISLSGGQKARLSLARAVYARADVYLLDDPLSAVDEHVGGHIIDNVLGEQGLLATKTRVLATNSITVLSHADNITMLSGGRIVEGGTYDEVMSSRAAIFTLLNEFGKKNGRNSSSGSGSGINTPSEQSTVQGTPSATIVEDEISISESAQLTSDASTVPELLAPLKRSRRDSMHTLRRASTASFTKPRVFDDVALQKAEQFKEHAEQGRVRWNVYKEYAKSADLRGVAAYFVLLVTAISLSVSGNFWLKHWSEINSRNEYNPHVGRYLGIYFGFCIGSALCILAYQVVLLLFCTIKSAKALHNGMLVSVVRAPMSFFETTPLGRVLNRFSNDIYRVDQILARVFSQFFANTIQVCFTLMVICVTTPSFIVLILPLGGLYVYYQRFYLRTSRELKRLDSVSRSPIYAHFQETLGGISTIRAYQQQERFNYINESRVDLNLKAYFPSVSSNRWLAVRLEFIGSVIILSASALSVASLSYSSVLTAGTIGLAMSYALQVTQSLNWIVRMTVEVETNIVSVERILEYSTLPSEAAEIIADHRPAATWPHDGAIQFDHYSTRYRPGLDLVLKDISLDIKPREKIGIVGRTGAGKSSLTLALFRIIEAVEGNINIDNLNTSTIGLSDLRHRLAIIPQDSQAFEGTIRDNLDPEGAHDDSELWRVLELSHLKDHVDTMGEGLESKINEGGSNLSVGQRQLMCLARALLTPSNVLVLDEATAAVDVETDHVLQETIRTEFKDRTILTIAHRLNTIMDSDRIIVLSAGQVAEFDSPANLLENKDSMFYSLSKQGGFVE